MNFWLFILFVCGWKPLDVQSMAILRRLNSERCIAVYPHTSIWDGFFFALYRLAYPTFLGHFYILVAKKFFWGPCGWLLRRFHCVPIDNVSQHGNQLENIAEEFKLKDQYVLLISPKGTTAKRKFRKGFLVLAQLLDVPIYVFGLDYLTHQACIVDTPFRPPSTPLGRHDTLPDISYEEIHNSTFPTGGGNVRNIKKGILRLFSHISPLYPDHEVEVPYDLTWRDAISEPL